ncbi:MAG: hypothetical protein ACM3NQ_00755 [Bacteroidales bacterium]
MTTLHSWTEQVAAFRQDVERIFGRRLRSIVAYDTHFGIETPMADTGDDRAHAHTLVLVETLTFADLLACAERTAAWAKDGVATPLLLTEGEFERSLDSFALEFANIGWHHVLIAGTDPFGQLRVDDGDLRRACETQAKSHLLHLREGFLETHGDPAAVARLIAASVPPLRSLLLNLARLDGVAAKSREALVHHAAARLDIAPALLEQLLALGRPGDLPASDAHRVYTAYLDAVERLTTFLDGWNRP